MNELGKTAPIWKIPWCLGVDDSEWNPGSDITSYVWWVLNNAGHSISPQKMGYFICVAWYVPVRCYKLHKSFHDSSSFKAWHGPTWWLAGLAIWSHLKEPGEPDCLCQVTLNGQPDRIRIGWLWRTSLLPNTRTVNLRVRPPGFQGNAFDIWIPLRCIVLPCGKRSSACSLSWIQTVHQCNQGPLRRHLGLASLVSAFPQWPGT